MTEPRRPRWKRKRWLAAAPLWLLVAYPLSGGPTPYGCYAGWLPPSVLRLYRPFPSGGDSAVARAWTAYVDWWLIRGVERGEANGTLRANRSGAG